MKTVKNLMLMSLLVLLTACGGSNSGGTAIPNPVNNAPTVNAGADQTVIAGESVSLSATINDEGTPTIAWTQTSGSPTVTLSSTTAASTSFTAPTVTAATTLTFQVTANDGSNPAVSDSVDVTINPQASSNLRTMQQELDFIRSKAVSLTLADTNYWEADFGNGLVMIYVPKGSFTMGNNELTASVVTGSMLASPAHQVLLDHYWISKYPITTGQFRRFVAATNFVTDVERATTNDAGCFVYDFTQEAFMPKLGYKWSDAYRDIIARHPEITINDNHPVSCVSWHDSIAYTNQLKAQYGLEFTLPTEAEWEYAARGNDGRVYPWGNEIPDGTRANYADETFNRYFPNLEQSDVHFGVIDGYAITSPVGSFPAGASPIGALDMAGNLTEWVFDSEYDYTASTKTNPIHNNTSNTIRLQKAGFWAGSAGRFGVTPNEIANGHNIRADARQGDAARSADDHLGFRIAISYTPRN